MEKQNYHETDNIADNLPFLAVESAPDVKGEVIPFADESISYQSYVPQTFEEKKELYHLLMADGEPLGEHLNEPITINRAMTKQIKMLDLASGEVQDRTTLKITTEDGRIMYTVSAGLVSSFFSLLKICGPLPWDFQVQAVSKKVKKGKLYYFDFA